MYHASESRLLHPAHRIRRKDNAPGQVFEKTKKHRVDFPTVRDGGKSEKLKKTLTS